MLFAHCILVTQKSVIPKLISTMHELIIVLCCFLCSIHKINLEEMCNNIVFVLTSDCLCLISSNSFCFWFECCPAHKISTVNMKLG